MRQRPGATTPGSSLTVAWQGLRWKTVHRHVFRLQKRLSRATQRGEGRTGQQRQKLPVQSWDARLLAGRRLTQDNRGQHTAGIDGVKSWTPPQRWRIAHELSLDGTASARRRLWMPQRGSTPDTRPLGIPTHADRARQPLVRPALDPEWEATRSAHTYGFRPGRSCHDAIGALFNALRFRPQSALKIDLAQGFDRLDPRALWAKGQTAPLIRRQLTAWRQAGILEDEHLSPTTAGTPPGGSGSPLLALLALHGMEEAITQVYPHARGIAYADDGGVFPAERQVLEHCQALLKTWLAKIGLSLNEAKSSMRPPLEGAQPGLAFWGGNLRQYRVGKHQAGKGPGGHGRRGHTTLIKPDKAKGTDHRAELGRIMERGNALPQGQLLHQLPPKIRGGAYYDRTSVRQAVYERLAHLTWLKLRHGARWRHPNKSTAWTLRRYWHP